MGSLGWPEMVFIFVLALLLFGPKELPELGRKLGKAMTEFRRASNELKATFDREMKNLEQEADLKELKQITSEYQYDTYNYDYSQYDGSNYEGTYGETYDTTATTPSITSASATEGAESPSAVAPAEEKVAVHEAAEGPHAGETVPRGSLEAASHNGHTEPTPATPEHKA
jgi:sec-independent protein translocase protein TatA